MSEKEHERFREMLHKEELLGESKGSVHKFFLSLFPKK